MTQPPLHPGVGAPSSARPGAPAGARSQWAWRDRPAVVWLAVAAIVALVHQFVPESQWLMVHAVMLGAVTHSIVVWSTHFTQALTKAAPAQNSRTVQTRRLVLLHTGVVTVVAGILTGTWLVTVVGAAVVGATVLWHAWALASMIRHSLGMRFAVTGRYYLTAALCLPVGAGFGAALAKGLSDDANGRLLVAHSMTMLLGWVGLTVMGTLLTLWPSMLAVRMAPKAERLARQSYWIALAGLVSGVAGALAGQRIPSAAGVLVSAAALVWWGRSLVEPLRQRLPHEFAPASVAAGVLWWLIALIALAIHVLRAPDWAHMMDGYGFIVAILVVGFAVQLVTGALSYLIPVVIGGGPRVRRAAQDWFNRGGAARLVLINAGLLVALLPVPGAVRVVSSAVVLLALLAFLVVMIRGIKAAVAVRKALLSEGADEGSRAVEWRRPTPFWTAGQVIGATCALALAVSLGIAVDPSAAGLSSSGASSTQAAVEPTGKTVRVAVQAKDMRYSPSSVRVQRGDRLVLEVTNTDATNRHDLVFPTAKIDRLDKGQGAQLDLGVVGESVQGWCSVIGHRQMGMVFDVVVAGDTEPGTGSQGQQAASGQHAAGHPGMPQGVVARAVDPVLPPLGAERVQRHTFTVQEVRREVAPGVWQQRWTYNGGAIGPTLHGRVGDTFVITLVNKGSMGHSIDFHAGVTPPDELMRTIAPGESLTYRFTAQRAGVWMYHCSSMPMTAHIAAGMHGAVVIEPDGLPAVDRQFLMVQSEVYLGEHTGRQDADPVNVDAALADDPSLFTFNGVAGQYASHPVQV
ncbi:MAG: multicopper oxidase domain-containing protein, partial [Micrococcales bacterium]|nr:multicopper oxidase domain-containing protein [Micrococcales bacterium]